MATTSRIQVFDTTLRDGEQAPGFSMTAAEKLRLAQQLDRLGVDIIEAGFPISSDGDFDAVRTIAGSVRRPIIAGLARAIPADIDRAWAALARAACKLLPGRNHGKCLHLNSMRRWVLLGRLRAWKRAGLWLVSRAEVLGMNKPREPLRDPGPFAQTRAERMQWTQEVLRRHRLA